jgi:hypothetical protein
MPPPARRALDPPPSDLPKLPRPRIQLAMPLARDAEMRRGQNPAARIGDRRGQRPLMRIDPDHAARMIGRHQQMRRSRTAPLRSLHLTNLQRYVVDGPADNIPVDTPHAGGERSYQARPIPEGKNRGRHFVRKTPPAGVKSLESQTSVQPSSLTRTAAHGRRPEFNTGIAFVLWTSGGSSSLIGHAVVASTAAGRGPLSLAL